MDLEWELENPALALGKYYTDVESFAKKKEMNEMLQMELTSKESQLSSKNLELDELKTKLQKMSDYVGSDTSSMIEAARREALEKAEEGQAKFDSDKRELLIQKDKDISENDAWLDMRLKEIVGDNADADRELTEIEKKALEFETARREFAVASDEKINGFQDAITQENLDCKTIVGEWKHDQDVIYSKFEPDVVKYREIIDDINRKYQPDIRQYQNLVAEKVEAKNEEIGQLQLERDREIQLADNEIAGYKKEYKQTDKQYNEQIRMAKLQNRPTTRMENNRVSRLNSINDQIQKVNNRLNKKVAGIDQKIEAASNNHEKQIGKAESQLNAVIQNRDQELEEPTNIYDGFIRDRDGQIASIQTKIDQRERECNNKISGFEHNIENEKSAQTRHNLEIDQQTITFVMSGDTCFSDVLNEAIEPFLALQGKINTWMELISTIKKEKMESAYPLEHEKQKSLLSSKSYQELQNDISEARQFNGTISAFAKNNKILTATGGALGGIGIIIMIILCAILKMSVGMLGMAVAAAGIAIIVLTFTKTNKEFAQICKYVSLATDYQEFPSISSHSTQIAQNRELGKMRNIGNKLYNFYYGKAEAQNIHDAKDADIKADYERNLKLLSKDFENTKAQIERDRENTIKKIKNAASEEEARFNSEKEEIQGNVQSLTTKISALDEKIKELKSEIKENDDFLSAFELNYKILEGNFGKEGWTTPMSYTHGKLSDVLYVIPEKGAADDYGHKKIYKLNHNKKALVITYDISNLGDGNGSQVEKIGEIIKGLMYDLMYSVYGMNSKETYVQYIVDEVVCTNEFKSIKAKNVLNIKEIAEKVEDIRGYLKVFAAQRERLAERATTIDEVNESKYSSQDRPEVYNILYIIYKPNERKNRLDDEIRSLISDCDKYGFLPVFICEKETWDREMQEKESMYKDIRDRIDNPVVVFDGVKYAEVN